MRIRALTIGQMIPFLLKNEIVLSFLQDRLRNFSSFANEFTDMVKDLDIEIDTKRFCSQPLFSYDAKLFYEKNLKETIEDINTQLKFLHNVFKDYAIDYFACAMMRADQIQEFGIFEKLLLNQVPQFIQNKRNFFTSLPVASTEAGINLTAIKSGAKIIKQLSDPDPFNNLQFCVSSNVGPNNPFFPAAYHLSEKPAFSLALEMADEVIKVIEASNSLKEAQFNLLAKFNEIYDNLTGIAEKVARNFDIEFKGIDFTPAPYPMVDKSIGTAIEKLGIDYFGANGTLTAVALIRNSIPIGKEKVIGFSGFMQPVLEDIILSKRLSENRFNLDSLILYSTMCGAGLDVVPLPGDITERELFYILLDICTISIVLNKPLTCRLMPIPGKNSGDDVEFDFEYFAPTKIIDFRRLEEEHKNDIYSGNEKNLKFL
jgi:uncharacterized protein (UPF0210 family)